EIEVRFSEPIALAALAIAVLASCAAAGMDTAIASATAATPINFFVIPLLIMLSLSSIQNVGYRIAVCRPAVSCTATCRVLRQREDVDRVVALRIDAIGSSPGKQTLGHRTQTVQHRHVL